MARQTAGAAILAAAPTTHRSVRYHGGKFRCVDEGMTGRATWHRYETPCFYSSNPSSKEEVGNARDDGRFGMDAHKRQEYQLGCGALLDYRVQLSS